jgi:hypothetical protein
MLANFIAIITNAKPAILITLYKHYKQSKTQPKTNLKKTCEWKSQKMTDLAKDN